MPHAAAASHSTAPPTRACTMSVFHQAAQVAASIVDLPLFKSPWEPGCPARPVPALLDFPTECHSRAFQVEFLNPQDGRHRQAWRCSPPLTPPARAGLLCPWVSGHSNEHQGSGRPSLPFLLGFPTLAPGVVILLLRKRRNVYSPKAQDGGHREVCHKRRDHRRPPTSQTLRDREN